MQSMHLLEKHASNCTPAQDTQRKDAYHIFSQVVVVNQEGPGFIVDGGHGSVEVHTANGAHLANIHLHIGQALFHSEDILSTVIWLFPFMKHLFHAVRCQ